jgi:hypothetical protein
LSIKKLPRPTDIEKRQKGVRPQPFFMTASGSAIALSNSRTLIFPRADYGLASQSTGQAMPLTSSSFGDIV